MQYSVKQVLDLFVSCSSGSLDRNMFLLVVLALAVGQNLFCDAIRSVCYDEMRAEFRCFDLWPPFTNTNFHLPASPTSQNIQFKLFTTHNRHNAQILRAGDTNSFHSSHWDKRHDTKIIVHGFTSDGSTSWVVDMTAALLKHGVNVIVVDWAAGAKGPNYIQAAANTRVVGGQIASLILTAEQLGSAPSHFHIIGHSLGSHIGGYAGSYLKGRLGRISGLDAAAPLFENYGNDVKLDKTDAMFVDAIHTDAEALHEAGLGTVDEIGHVDFFPNGGRNMPGCSADKFSWVQLLTGQISALTDDISCSHGRAPLYFTASINDNLFTSYPCATPDGGCTKCGSGCTSMGYHATPNFRGLFVTTTKAHYPF
ncbi:hypothetical protein V1264_001996 [Littorina saxatilis]|uniref:Lipase domain-containing protein n=2 Tax=Littorina saxatilis TaxID=31220 RepID=A0AAN9C2M7_9CAEN